MNRLTSPADSNLSPVQNTDLSTKSTEIGDTGDTGHNIDKTNQESSNLKLYRNELELQKKIKERELYRRWPGSDTWACPNCNDSGDKFHMVNHLCRRNKKI